LKDGDDAVEKVVKVDCATPWIAPEGEAHGLALLHPGVVYNEFGVVYVSTKQTLALEWLG
jgi:hypothetical protein